MPCHESQHDSIHFRPRAASSSSRAAVAGAGITILPSGLRGGPSAPSNKLNIAMIGTWGRARAHFGAVKGENVVALCDIDETHIDIAAEAVSQGPALRRLAKVPRPEGHRRGRLLDHRFHS